MDSSVFAKIEAHTWKWDISAPHSCLGLRPIFAIDALAFSTMAYEPLHHKYRPATFADLVGQEAITNTLTSAIRQQRIAPAYLFSGPRGTGKTSSARILAKSLNCEASDRPTATPCGQCEICRSITNGSAVDVIEIDAASNTGVDNIRELIERAQFAPVKCRYKVYAVDECHMLSTAAFNSLLKTLEEPPDRVVFVLATTDPQRVLPTIISRCQRFDYRRIRLDAMVDHLAKIATIENIQVSPEALTLIAQMAQGGMRDAESLLDQLSLLDERVMPQHVWDLVGAVPERDLLDLVRSIASDRPEAVLDCCRSMLDRGREPLTVLQSLANFYRDFLIAKTASDRPELTSVTSATWPELCDFSQGWSVEQILLGGQHLRSCEGQIKNTTQPRLWLEVSLLGLLPSAIAARSGGGQPISPISPMAGTSGTPIIMPPAQAPSPLPSPQFHPPQPPIPSAYTTSAIPPTPINHAPITPTVTPAVTPTVTPTVTPAPTTIPVAPAMTGEAITTDLNRTVPDQTSPRFSEEDDYSAWDAIDPDMSPDIPATRTEHGTPAYFPASASSPTPDLQEATIAPQTLIPPPHVAVHGASPPLASTLPTSTSTPISETAIEASPWSNSSTSFPPSSFPSPPQTPPQTPAPTVETQVFNLPQVWQQVISHIQMRATRELLNQKCRLSAFDGQTARISVLASALQSVVKRKQGDLETAFSYVFGTPIGVAIDIAVDAQTPAPTIDPRQPPSHTPNPTNLPAVAAPPFSAPAPFAPPPIYPTPAPITAPVSTPIAPPSYSAPPVSPNYPDSVSGMASTTTNGTVNGTTNGTVNGTTSGTVNTHVSTTQSLQTPPTSIPPTETTTPSITSTQLASLATSPGSPSSILPSTPSPSIERGNHTPIVSASGRQWEESEIANAAQQLAQFFGGEVVTLDEDVLN